MRRCFLHRAQGDGMAAMVVRAVDEDAVHAHVVAHLAEGDFLGSRCEYYFDSALPDALVPQCLWLSIV